MNIVVIPFVVLKNKVKLRNRIKPEKGKEGVFAIWTHPLSEEVSNRLKQEVNARKIMLAADFRITSNTNYHLSSMIILTISGVRIPGFSSPPIENKTSSEPTKAAPARANSG